MNFLAHAFLAGDDPADQLGGLMGDFVKGPLPAGLPPDVAEGVRLHRRIDVFADTHPAFQRSRARCAVHRRRVSGIVVDMAYDHFLARHWARYQPDLLTTFSARMYALMDAHAHWLPERLERILPRMRDDDWLASYADARNVVRALERIALRLRRPDALLGAGDDFLGDYAGFESDFFAFIDDAAEFARVHRLQRTPPRPDVGRT